MNSNQEARIRILPHTIKTREFEMIYFFQFLPNNVLELILFYCAEAKLHLQLLKMFREKKVTLSLLQTIN